MSIAQGDMRDLHAQRKALKTGERASTLTQDMPEHERPISEEFRLVAKAWVDAESAASLLEETKSATLAEKMQALGDMPVNRAELTVKASKDWHEHLAKISEARREANLRKVQMEYVRMKFSEWQAADANSRNERRMSR